MKVLKTIERTVEAILITTAIAISALAQNIVDLHVESQPKYSKALALT